MIIDPQHYTKDERHEQRMSRIDQNLRYLHQAVEHNVGTTNLLLVIICIVLMAMCWRQG